MKRLLAMAAAAAILLVIGAQVVLAADAMPATGRVLVSVRGPVDIAAGDHLDTLVVIDGDARVSGDVRTIVVVRGTATLSGATTGNLVIADGSADLQAGTTVLGDVRTFRGTVTQQQGATVQGSVRALDSDLAALAWLLIPALVLLFLGLGVAAIVAALLVAAFASRQVRAVELLISRQPGQVLVAGIGSTIVLPIFAVLLVATVIGAPAGIALLLVLPVIAFLAWIVAAIWIGDWIVARRRTAPEPDRPYRAAIIGVVTLAICGLLPFVGAIATLFGFGALVLAAWRTLTRPTTPLTGGAPATTVYNAG